jgi:transcriptional regulator with XRE-family HTH domain
MLATAAFPSEIRHAGHGVKMPSQDELLNPDELRRRIRAARELKGLSQDEMNAAGAAMGLPGYLLGALERGQKTIEPFHLDPLCRVLEVPISWFTEPRKVLVARRPQDYLEIIEELLELVRAAEDPPAARPTGLPSDDEGPTGPLPGIEDDDEGHEPPGQVHDRTRTHRQGR